jgi:hypothetical protein
MARLNYPVSEDLLYIYTFIYVRIILCPFITTWKCLHCDREVALFFRLLRNVHYYYYYYYFQLRTAAF